MNAALPHDPDRFYGGPPMRLERLLGLIRPDDMRTRVRAILFILIAWVPLLLLTGLQEWTRGDGSLRSFLLDFAAYARYIVAAPLLILAESYCFPRFERIILHFRNSGLVRSTDREAYENIIASSCRLIDSRFIEILAFVLAYALIAALLVFVRADQLPPWQVSLAGHWHAFISLPLLLVALLGWVWRQTLWTRLLWLTSRLDLQIVPAHPDKCGGLRFLSTFVRGYWPLAFACASIVAGGIANRVVNDGAPVESFQYVMIGMTAFFSLIFLLPLTSFVPTLRRAQAKGMFEYDALARGLGSQFERKWLRRRETIKPDALSVSDFSATTDLYSIVSNVYQMTYLPVSFRSVRGLLIITALPYVPVILARIPLVDVLSRILKLLI